MDNSRFPMQESRPGVNGFPMNSAGDNGQPDLKGKVFSKARDEYGCQLLHQKLQQGKPEDIQMIFSEVKDHICTLMMDPFGSDVIQKLFQVCDAQQMNQLVSSLTADARLFMSVCLHSQGSESMKKLLECRMTTKQISPVISSLSYFTVPLANHHIGSRVIAHCFDIFPIPAKESEPIYDMIDENLMEIARNKSGSCLLQEFITRSGIEKYFLGFILSSILLNGYTLSTDKFGSRVVLHLIGLEVPGVINHLLEMQLNGSFDDLSMDEYGSVVVKKLIGALRGKYARQIIDEIINSPRLLYVLVDPCGYSVLEYAKNYSKGILLKTLNDLIRRHSQLLNKK